MNTVWLNTELYSNTQLFFYLGGFFLWGAAYVFVIRNIHRDKFVEVPIIAVCGNITWEILWGFFFTNDMGRLLTLFYAGGALLDGYILYSLFRYGYKQVNSEAIRRQLTPLIGMSLLVWTSLYIAFKNTGYDLPLGSNSAYLVNLVMSVMYILFALSYSKIERFSMTVGWLKGVGTGMVSVFVFITYPDNPFVMTIALACAVLDVTYLVLLHRRQSQKTALGGVAYVDLEDDQPRITQSQSTTDKASMVDPVSASSASAADRNEVR